MKFCRKYRVCGKSAAAMLITAIFTISSVSQNKGVARALTSPSRNQSTRRRHFDVLSRVTKLFAVDGGGSEKVVIEVLTDQNRDFLLRPSIDPSRPILVDAFAPWCGPCKLLDKVLKKAQPRYIGKVDFCRWNVNDAENTAQIKSHFIEMGYTLNKLPSLIVYREGEPIAVRPGFANEFQLDDWLEKTLPDVLERTFDENGVKIEPVSMLNVDGNEKGPALDTGSKTNEIFGDMPTPEMTKEDKVVRQVFSPIDFKSTVMTERLRITRRSDFQTANDKFLTQVDEVISEEDDEVPTECTDETKCWEMVEETLGWENRTVVPASAGILLPSRMIA